MKQTTCVCVAIVAFGVGTGCIATKQTYVARGNKLYDAGKYADASLNYRKAIQKDSKFGEAYYRLGLSAIKQDQVREAYDSLFRAIQLSPNNVQAKEQFADVCMAIYLASSSHPLLLYKQISQLSDELLAGNPNSYEGLMLKGYLASTDRQPKEAVGYFRKALAINSADAGVTAQLVRVLIESDQPKEAEQLGKELIARKKDYGPIYDVLYGLYTSTGRTADAENLLEAKVRNNPNKADYFLQLAQYYVRTNKTADLKATQQRMIADPKNFPQARLWIGDFYIGLKNYSEALHYYRDGADQHGQDALVYNKRIAVTLLAEGNREEAFRLTTALLKENPKDDDLLHMHADFLIDSGKIENADNAQREFQMLLQEHPDDPSLRVQLARVYRLKGDLGAARKELAAALDRSKDLPAARDELAEISLAEQRPEDAVRQANEALKQHPKDPRARLLHARGLMGSGNLADARAELTDLVKESPQYTEARIELGALSMMENKYPEAIDIFNKLRDSGDPRAYSGLAAAYSFTRHADKAHEVLEEGLKKWPNSTMLLEQLAGIQAITGNYDAAITQFRAVIAKDPKSVSARRHLGDIYESRGDHFNAINLYQQAHDLAPNDITVSMILADSLAAGGRADDAKKLYEAISSTHPDNTAAMNNLAFLLADTGGDLDQALRLAKLALVKLPKQPAYSDTIGYIYLKKGLNDSAMQTFTQLVHNYPHLASFHYHLGMALVATGDKVAAKKELQSALNEHPSLKDKAKIRELLEKIG